MPTAGGCSLHEAFARFDQTLHATTVPVAAGSRRVDGVAHAIALSEATSKLHQALAAAQASLLARHSWTLDALPSFVELLESDSPDGPWTPVPPEAIVTRGMGVGAPHADAVLVAALDSAARVAAFPADRWNSLQSARPGADHHRWRAGDVISADELATLESAARLLALLPEESAELESGQVAKGDSPATPVGSGMTWQQAKEKAERHVKHQDGRFPGRNALAELVGCSKPTMSKAIEASVYLRARQAETGGRAKGREVSLGNVPDAVGVPSRDLRSDQQELDRLTAEQKNEEAREERQHRAAKRGRGKRS